LSALRAPGALDPWAGGEKNQIGRREEVEMARVMATAADLRATHNCSLTPSVRRKRLSGPPERRSLDRLGS